MATVTMLDRIKRWRAWWAAQPKPPSVDEINRLQDERDRAAQERAAEELARHIAKYGHHFPGDDEGGPTVTHGPDGSTWIRW
jgi:hypothetical protein